MASDEKRREVAQALRNNLKYMIRKEEWYGKDLIDRPTCFDTESKDSKSFTCSACGFSESKLVVNPFTLSFSWVKPSYRYCPKCGAMVVEKEEDNG